MGFRKSSLLNCGSRENVSCANGQKKYPYYLTLTLKNGYSLLSSFTQRQKLILICHFCVFSKHNTATILTRTCFCVCKPAFSTSLTYIVREHLLHVLALKTCCLTVFYRIWPRFNQDYHIIILKNCYNRTVQGLPAAVGCS